MTTYDNARRAYENAEPPAGLPRCGNPACGHDSDDHVVDEEMIPCLHLDCDCDDYSDPRYGGRRRAPPRRNEGAEMSAMTAKLTEGWAFASSSRKAHYFTISPKAITDRGGFSLCGNYGFFSNHDALEADDGEPRLLGCLLHCRRKLDKRGVL